MEVGKLIEIEKKLENNEPIDEILPITTPCKEDLSGRKSNRCARFHNMSDEDEIQNMLGFSMCNLVFPSYVYVS